MTPTPTTPTQLYTATVASLELVTSEELNASDPISSRGLPRSSCAGDGGGGAAGGAAAGGAADVDILPATSAGEELLAQAGPREQEPKSARALVPCRREARASLLCRTTCAHMV